MALLHSEYGWHTNQENHQVSWIVPPELDGVSVRAKANVLVDGAYFSQLWIYKNTTVIDSDPRVGYTPTTGTRLGPRAEGEMVVSAGDEIKVFAKGYTPNGAATSKGLLSRFIVEQIEIQPSQKELLQKALIETARPNLFSIDQFDQEQGTMNAVISGTSGNVGWTYTGVADGALSITDGSFQDFMEGTAYHLENSDAIHLWAQGSFQFDRTVDGVFMYVHWHPSHTGADLIDFGVTPQIITGDILIEGNAFGSLTRSGGVVYLPINSDQMAFTSPESTTVNNRCTDIALVFAE